MLNEIAASDIAAILVALGGIIGTVGAVAHRQAKKSTTSASLTDASNDFSLASGSERVDLLITRMSVLEALTRGHKQLMEDNTGALIRATASSERLLQGMNSLVDGVGNVRSDMRDGREAVKEDRDAVRDELRAFRGSEKLARAASEKQVRDDLQQGRVDLQHDRDAVRDELQEHRGTEKAAREEQTRDFRDEMSRRFPDGD